MGIRGSSEASKGSVKAWRGTDSLGGGSGAPQFYEWTEVRADLAAWARATSTAGPEESESRTVKASFFVSCLFVARKVDSRDVVTSIAG